MLAVASCNVPLNIGIILHVTKFSLCQQLVAVGSSVISRDLSKKPIYLTPEQWHQQLSDCDKDTLLIDMRNHYE